MEVLGEVKDDERNGREGWVEVFMVGARRLEKVRSGGGERGRGREGDKEGRGGGEQRRGGRRK